MDWTEERTEQLKQLWAEGLSASQIAARLGGVTRSAVIGKSYRLCLAPRKSANPEQIKNKRRAAQLKKMERQKAIGSIERSPRLPRINARSGGMRPGTADDVARAAADWRAIKAEMERQDGARTDLVDLLKLEEHQCRWPIGEPTRGFCGKSKVPGKSYCAGHLARSIVRAAPEWLPRAPFTKGITPPTTVDELHETVAA